MTRSWQGAQPPWVFAGFVDKRVQTSAEEQPRRFNDQLKEFRV
jgi:hypothetical protein